MRKLLTAAIAIAILATLLFAWQSGWRLLMVDGGSMEPTIHNGELLINRPASAHELVEGAVVTIGEPPSSFRTHRVVEVRADGSAILQGDANTAPDPGKVTEADVASVPIWHGSPWLVIGGVAALALIYVAWPTGVRRPAKEPAAEPTTVTLDELLATDVADSAPTATEPATAVHVVGDR